MLHRKQHRAWPPRTAALWVSNTLRSHWATRSSLGDFKQILFKYTAHIWVYTSCALLKAPLCAGDTLLLLSKAAAGSPLISTLQMAAGCKGPPPEHPSCCHLPPLIQGAPCCLLGCSDLKISQSQLQSNELQPGLWPAMPAKCPEPVPLLGSDVISRGGGFVLAARLRHSPCRS